MGTQNFAGFLPAELLGKADSGTAHNPPVLGVEECEDSAFNIF